MDEGYIKFHAEHIPAPPLPENLCRPVISVRQKLFEMGLIGAYPDGIGFGNVSRRLEGEQFLITASATGNLPRISPTHLSKVLEVVPERNYLKCTGPRIASSESMSHAAVYRQSPRTNGVIHVHHFEWWEKLLYKVPTTPPHIAYGTPEMARAIADLFDQTEVARIRLFALAGHREGIFAFGPTLEAAFRTLQAHYTAAGFGQ
ncbi:MAG: class II aldolase/adducin family protein [Bacteroidetes bacterium]|nr:MAG: class II aldolase/adducin family protein [Bacteroidota bacterium]